MYEDMEHVNWVQDPVHVSKQLSSDITILLQITLQSNLFARKNPTEDQGKTG
jgi:hypothetical protein